MALEFVKFNRRTFEVIGVRITAENIFEVATWVNGWVKYDGQVLKPHEFAGQNVYLEFVGVGNRDTQKLRSYIGEWITGGKNFMRYADASLQSLFQPVDPKKTEAIEKLVKEAMAAQDASTYYQNGWDMDQVAREITEKISKIL